MAYYPKIKILRKENGKSKKEIVNYLGTKKKYYNLYENGSNEIAFTRASPSQNTTTSASTI